MPGVRVLLVSCGAEETLQDGIRAFIARHRGELDADSTWFVNLDTVGSPHLVMLEAEGPVWMESYTGAWLRDLVAERAEHLGVELRARLSRARLDRQRDPEPRRVSDRDARVDDRLAQSRELPPARATSRRTSTTRRWPTRRASSTTCSTTLARTRREASGGERAAPLPS